MNAKDFNKIMEAIAAISKEINDCCDALDKKEKERETKDQKGC